MNLQPLPTAEPARLVAAYTQFNSLIDGIKKFNLDPALLNDLSGQVERVNQAILSGTRIETTLRQSQTKMIQLLAAQAKIVTIGHYRRMWTALGMTAIGLPLGVAFGTAIGNIAWMGVGLPFGLMIGYIMGSNFDTKAKNEGRQIPISLKYY